MENRKDYKTIREAATLTFIMGLVIGFVAGLIVAMPTVIEAINR